MAVADPVLLVAGGARYRALAWRRVLLLAGLAALLGLSVAVDMGTGPAAYPRAWTTTRRRASASRWGACGWRR